MGYRLRVGSLRGVKIMLWLKEVVVELERRLSSGGIRMLVGYWIGWLYDISLFVIFLKMVVILILKLLVFGYKWLKKE